MNLILVLTYVSLAAYILFAKRHQDVNFVIASGFLVYFFPFVIGSFDSSVDAWVTVILVTLFATVFLCDVFGKSTSFQIVANKNTAQLVRVLVVISISSFMLLISNGGVASLFVGKTNVSMNYHVYGVFTASVSLGLLYSYCFRYFGLLSIFSIFMALIFLMGSRTHIALVLLALFALSLGQSRKRLVWCLFSGKRLGLLICFIVIGLFGKSLYAAFQLYLANEVGLAMSLLGDSAPFEVVLASVKLAEPFHVAGIFEKVSYFSSTNFTGWYLSDMPYHLLPVASPFTDTLHHFSSSLKSEFFVDWGGKSGVGANYWAEGYVLSPVWGVPIFLGVYAIVSLIIFLASRSMGILHQPMLMLLAAYWGLYIHRNSLFQIISHEKRVIYVYVLTLIILGLIGVFFKVMGKVIVDEKKCTR